MAGSQISVYLSIPLQPWPRATQWSLHHCPQPPSSFQKKKKSLSSFSFLLPATTLSLICNQHPHNHQHPHHHHYHNRIQSVGDAGGRMAMQRCLITISNRSVNKLENHMQGTGEVKASTILSSIPPPPHPSYFCFTHPGPTGLSLDTRKQQL